MKLKTIRKGVGVDGVLYDYNLVFNVGQYLRWMLLILTAVMIHDGSKIALLIPVIMCVSQGYFRTDRNKLGE